MNTINLLRFMVGYIEFEATGGFADRFINLCNYHHINIFNLSYQHNGIRACIPAKSLYKLKEPAKKSGVKLRLIEMQGLYFLFKKHYSRIALLAGVIIYAVFCIVMQQFVWNIEIEQSKNVSCQDIRDLLKDNGLYLGTHTDSFDEIQCSREIINTLKGKLQWMSINIKGSKAFVEIHDYNEERKDDTYGSAANIVADFDGVIMSIEAYTGEKAAKAGNGVSKGDLLISGIVENRDFSASFFEARGKITALHNVDYFTSNKANKKFKRICDVNEKKFLFILGLKIPLQISMPGSTNSSYDNNSFLFMKNTELPFGICKKNIIKTTDNYLITDKESCSLLALSKYTEQTYKKFSNSNIISCEHQLNFTKDSYNISSKYYCIDFMGVKQLINTNIF